MASIKAISVIVFTSLLVSCTQYKYIPVHTATEKEIMRYTHDTVIWKDTVKIANRGDTVFVDRIKYRAVVKDRRDTIIQRDTIPAIVEVEKKVTTHELYWWHKCLICIGLISICALMVRMKI